MKFELIPHSSATNSYALLEDVIKAIDEEPKRFHWGEWLQDAAYSVPADDQPACGTLACIAGWTNLLTSTGLNEAWNKVGSTPTFKWFPSTVETDLSQLFYANWTGEMDKAPNESQRSYADRGIAAIRLFMDTHEEALKGFTISIPPREAQ